MRNWISDLESCGLREGWQTRLRDSLVNTSLYPSELKDVIENLRSGTPLTIDQGLKLWN